MARKIFLFIVLVAFALIAVLVVSTLVLKDTNELIVKDTSEETEAEAVKETTEVALKPTKTTLFATMLAFNTNEGMRGISKGPEVLMNGWSSLLADEDNYERFLSELIRAFEKNATLADETGFSSNRDVVGAFVWNVIEPTKGEYNWSIPDATLKAAGQARVTLSAVIQPFASWDQTEITAEEYKEKCSAIDFGYYDFKAGAVKDWDAYEQFLAATVERYDGDGIEDMQNLATRVEAWEIGNEIEGSCGGFSGDPEGYIELLRSSYETIKQADPTAIVLNGGALEILGFDGKKIKDISEFWEEFFDLNGDRYIDAFNFHHNHERGGADATPDRWVKTIGFFNDLMENSDGKKPLWVTEFGTYSGTPSGSSRPGGSSGDAQTLPTQSAEFQASWYFRYAVIGFANGLERIFIDLEGDDKAGIGASSLYNEGPGKDGTPRAFLATLQAMADVLNGFEEVEEIANGQYAFTVGDKTIYALWSGSLPLDLREKTLTVIGVDGEEDSLTSDELDLSEDAPVLVWLE